jgi:hypothetical protein
MTFIFLIRVVTHLVDSLFGGVVPLSREARSYFYTLGFPRGNGGCSLNLYTQLYVCKYQQRKRSLWYEGHVTYYCHLASIVCKLLDFNLLLSNYLANWNQTWYECSLNDFLQNLCCCFKGFKEGVSILYMDFNYLLFI